jgi:hypothetical protein
MPGVARRDKPLKASGAFSDLDGVTLSGLTSGDILVHDGSDFVNTKALVGTYTLTGTLTATDLTTTDDVTVGDDLIVTGLATIGETLSVTGNATLQGAATVGTTLGVTGAATLSSTLSVAGLLSGAGFSFSGNGTIAGTLGVTGASTLGALSATTLSTSGLATLASLSVTGTTTLNDQLTVNAALTAGAISGSSVGSSGDVTVGATLEGPAWDLSRSAPTITFATTTNDDTLLFTGNTDIGAGQITRNMLALDAAAAGGVLVYSEGTLELSVLTGNVLVANAIEIDGDLNHDGSNVGFFGIAPVARAAAYTQTFATADRTHAARTSAAITVTYTTDDPAITPDAALTIADGDTPTVNELLEYCEELNDQLAKTRADLADSAELLNAVVDDLQAYGLLQ